MTQTQIERSPEFWAAVKEDYDGGLTLTAIYRRHGLTKGAFDYHRAHAGWANRNRSPVNRERLVGRIFALINKHLKAMEKKMDAGSHADVAVLNQLVGSLGRLIRFEAASAKASRVADPTADLEDIREKLVQRIEELKRG